jgi:dynein heavy chain
VQPKREALAAANAELNRSQLKLKEIQDKVARLNKQLKKLTDEFEAATDEKNRVQAQADATAARMSLAQRLVKGLASENVRWARQIELFRNEETTLAGDVLLAAAFVSYIGGFSRRFREVRTTCLYHREEPVVT